MDFALDFMSDMMHSGINRKGFVFNEDNLLEVIRAPRNKSEVCYAVILLREYRTTKSIPILKSLIDFPKEDVKCCVPLTIAQIAGESESTYFGELLMSPAYREKTYAMWAIASVGNMDALPFVIQYFDKNHAKLKQGKLTNGTAILGAIYLLRLSESIPQAGSYLDRHVGNFLDNSDEVQIGGWDTLHGRPKNEWVAELFALARRKLPSFVGPRPKKRT